MADTQRVYSPQKVITTWMEGLVDIKHFASGTSITVARSTDNTTSEVGMQGDVAHTFNADKTGVISFVIQQTAQTNIILSSIQALQDQTGELIRGNLVIEDPSGGALVIARNCHIQKPTDVSFGDTPENKTWTFMSEHIEYLDLPAGLIDVSGLAARASGLALSALNKSRELN